MKRLENVEGRALGKFNCEEETFMEPSEFQNKTETKLTRIAWLSSKDTNKVFRNIMHHFNEESLRGCYNELDGRKAVGADGVTKEEYGNGLTEKLQDLVGQMKRMGYRPKPVREVLIPKPDKPGATRPLGISNFEDKIVQKMTQKVLESIYEPIFLDNSYGFRPGRGCHDAVRALTNYLFRNEVEKVIDVDISNFFGTIDIKVLSEILGEKIRDKKFIRYINRMSKAGVLRNGELEINEEGVQQGSMCSPILANIYAHYVVDEWFEEIVKIHCKGKVELFRYCDDAVICCQYAKDAERIKDALAKRLEKYNLKLNVDKTHSVSFSKRQRRNGVKQGTFDFLGFTFYLGRSATGVVIPKVKTSKKRLRNKLKNLTEWIKGIKDRVKLKQIWELFSAKLRGHFQYYGVSHNFKSISQFRHVAIKIMFKWLNRRSQRRSFNWEKFQKFIKSYPLPHLKIHHKIF